MHDVQSSEHVPCPTPMAMSRPFGLALRYWCVASATALPATTAARSWASAMRSRLARATPKTRPTRRYAPPAHRGRWARQKTRSAVERRRPARTWLDFARAGTLNLGREYMRKQNSCIADSRLCATRAARYAARRFLQRRFVGHGSVEAWRLRAPARADARPSQRVGAPAPCMPHVGASPLSCFCSPLLPLVVRCGAPGLAKCSPQGLPGVPAGGKHTPLSRRASSLFDRGGPVCFGSCCVYLPQTCFRVKKRAALGDVHAKG